MGERKVSIEDSLQVLEDKTSIVIKTLLKEKNLSVLTKEDRGWLAMFVVVQHLRTRQARENEKKINEGLKDHVLAMPVHQNLGELEMEHIVLSIREIASAHPKWLSYANRMVDIKPSVKEHTHPVR